MRNPVFFPIMFLLLAIALYIMPDGSFYTWQLYLRGVFARLHRAPDPNPDATDGDFFRHRDLLDLILQKDAEIADLHRRLRDLAVTTESVDKVRITPARIVRLGPDNNLDIFTIDAGTEQMVAPGQAVVVGAALVGVVVKSEPNASLVLSLSSRGCYISARLGEPSGSLDRPRALAGVRGARAGTVRIITFSSDTGAREGWVAMTSGLEKQIPAGLVLGAVASSFVDGEESGTMEAELRPMTDLSSLDYVAVIAKE